MDAKDAAPDFDSLGNQLLEMEQAIVAALRRKKRSYRSPPAMSQLLHTPGLSDVFAFFAIERF
jgi:hypothetical protein